MTANQGQFIGHTAHEACGSSDALALYEHSNGTTTGYCWACSAWIAPERAKAVDKSRLLVRRRSPEETVAEIVRIYNSMPVMLLKDRAITEPTAKVFGVRAEVAESDGHTVVKHFYPYYKKGVLSAYKIRRVKDKGFYSIGDMTGCDLFGQTQAEQTGSKRVFVTEGECDAMALYQAITEHQKGTKWEAYRPAVVSLAKGADKSAEGTKVLNELGAQKDFFNRFEEIIFVFDQDEAGEQSAKVASQLFSGKAKIAKLPLKDANEMLQANRSGELYKAVLFQAQAHKPSSIRSVADVFEQARKKATWGTKYPWPTLTRMTYGIRRGELIGVGAGVGCGKTAFWHELEFFLMMQCQEKIGVFMLEEPNGKTLKMLASKIAGKNFYSPETTYTQEELDAAILALDGKIVLFNHSEDRSWETIKLAIRHMVLVENIRFIILDPISALTYMFDSSRANDELNKIFGEVAGMAETLGFSLFFSSHLNPPDSGQPHEEGGRVKAAQFTGSRAMIKWSHYILGLERNTQAPLPDERNTSTLRVLKDREYGNTGTIALFYDDEKRTFLEKDKTLATTKY